MTSDRPAALARIARVLSALALLGCSSDSSRDSDASVPADASPGDARELDSTSGDSGTTCNIPECFRPIDCRLSCSGPVVVSSCCPCMPPAFDDLCCRADACAGPL